MRPTLALLPLTLLCLGLAAGCTDRVPDIEGGNVTTSTAAPVEDAVAPRTESMVGTWGERQQFQELAVLVDEPSEATTVSETENRRIVETAVTLTNTGSQPVHYSPRSFVLQCDDALVYNPHAGDSPSFLRGGTLEPGDEVEGVLRFEIPQPSKIARVAYYPEAGDGSFIAWRRP